MQLHDKYSLVGYLYLLTASLRAKCGEWNKHEGRREYFDVGKCGSDARYMSTLEHKSAPSPPNPGSMEGVLRLEQTLNRTSVVCISSIRYLGIPPA